MAMKNVFSIFEYQYRDGGNFKSCDALLLRGEATTSAIQRLASSLIDSEFFYAEEVSIPPLFEGVTKWGQSDLDVSWHEFCALRPATPQESIELKCYGDLDELIAAFEKAKVKRGF